MMTAQAAARAQEMALRISIGAGRRRLVQLILCQSALLALLASVLGAFFAAWSAPFVLSLVNPPDNPARLALPADWRVLLFGFGLIDPRRSLAWFASCSPCLCRPARRRAQRR